MPTWLHNALLTILIVSTAFDLFLWINVHMINHRRMRMGMQPYPFSNGGMWFSILIYTIWVFFICYWVWG